LSLKPKPRPQDPGVRSDCLILDHLILTVLF
jgi:hypothetical protein